MEGGPLVARRQVKIVNAYGLHMRPSNRFVTLASKFQADVWVYHGDRKANGKSMIEMTMLAAECGSFLEIEASGTDADQAVEALVELVAAGFHMDEEGA